MASIIRVGQSKFVSVPIDEDSSERIMNCIQTLSELEAQPAVHDIFLKDTKAAYSKMVAAQEVRCSSRASRHPLTHFISVEEGSGEEGVREGEGGDRAGR